MDLTQGQVFHGFTVDRVRELSEIRATLYEMTHTRSGASLCWCKTSEENKLFSIAFKTLPENSTGVFHILEHSVLNGSERYPVREPFVELIKGSMNTFLNAMTFSDKTMYPVSSRNEQDFLNLTKVYLDAVFAPAILHNRFIFMQEGWHIEKTSDEAPAEYKGVVFNEMKGDMSSVDNVMEEEADRVLFSDNCYGFNSGGNPAAITDLSYEEFVDTYKRFYHPDNSRIWLDGDIPAERTFALIDEYLSRFTLSGRSIDFRLQAPKPATTVYRPYAISPEEDGANKCHIQFIHLSGGFKDKLHSLACSVLLDAVASGNDSPIKRVILDNELGQDIDCSLNDGTLQSSFGVWIRNTEADKVDDIRRLLNEKVRELVKNGIDRKDLEASINRLAFRLKEPVEPQGLMRAVMALNSWLYGGDPAEYLTFDREIAQLREMLDTRRYEELLEELFLNDKETHTIILTPDRELSARLQAEEQRRLDAVLGQMTTEQIAQLVRDTQELIKWQQTPDTPEALATLPRLSLDVVSPQPETIPTDIGQAGAAVTLHHDAPCPGIVHAAYYFKLEAMSGEELTDLALLPNLLGELPTKDHTVTELQRDIKLYTGSLDIDISVNTDKRDREHCQVYLTATFSALRENLDKAAALMREILLTTDMSDRKLIREILLQTDDDLRQSAIMSGNRFAAQRAQAHYGVGSAVSEHISGITLIKRSHELCADLDRHMDALTDFYRRTLSENAVTSHLILSTTGERVDPAILIRGYQEGVPCRKGQTLSVSYPLREAFVIPAQISYAALCWSLYEGSTDYDATADVLSNILSYSYLWNTVRVQGGAYGVSFFIRPTGAYIATSFRDPKPGHTLAAYRGMRDYTERFIAGDEDLTGYIISTIGQSEPLLTPRARGRLADTRYLRHVTEEERRQNRQKLLHMTRENLKRWLEPLTEAAQKGAVCVLGNEAAISELTDEGLTVQKL